MYFLCAVSRREKNICWACVVNLGEETCILSSGVPAGCVSGDADDDLPSVLVVTKHNVVEEKCRDDEDEVAESLTKLNNFNGTDEKKQDIEWLMH